MKKKLENAMNTLSAFSQDSYNKKDTPVTRAIFKSLYLNYLRVYEEMQKAGLDPCVSEKLPLNLSDEEYKKMQVWECLMIIDAEATLFTEGLPEKN